MGISEKLLASLSSEVWATGRLTGGDGGQKPVAARQKGLKLARLSRFIDCNRSGARPGIRAKAYADIRPVTANAEVDVRAAVDLLSAIATRDAGLRFVNETIDCPKLSKLGPRTAGGRIGTGSQKRQQNQRMTA